MAIAFLNLTCLHFSKFSSSSAFSTRGANVLSDGRWPSFISELLRKLENENKTKKGEEREGRVGKKRKFFKIWWIRFSATMLTSCQPTNETDRQILRDVYQNRGVCGQAFLFIIPFLPFFALITTFSSNSRGNTCYTGYMFLVKSNKWSIINAAFWLVELLLGYML